MGKKGNWIRTVKKAFSGSSSSSSGSKDNGGEEEKPGSKSKTKWFSKKKSSGRYSTIGTETVIEPVDLPTHPPSLDVAEVSRTANNQIPKEIVEDTRSNNFTVKSTTVTAATTTSDQSSKEPSNAVEHPPVTSLEPPEQSRMMTSEETGISIRFPGKSKDEIAAIIIQTVFRGYLARRAVRVMRGLARLNKLMQSPGVNRQTASTLKSMQTLAWIQAQIRAQRVRMSEENQARQQQLLSKQTRELEKSKLVHNKQTEGGVWDLSWKSKDQIEAKMQSKNEAAMRRERAMAYSFNHQQTWRTSTTPRSAHTLYIDSTNPHWGWSWLERWIAARPWEISTARDATNPAYAALRIAQQDKTKSSSSSGGGGSLIAKALLYHVNSNRPTPPSSTTSSPKSAPPRRANSTFGSQSIATPGRVSTSSKSRGSMVSRKFRQASPHKARGSAASADDDARSVMSLQSDMTDTTTRGRRLSFGDDTESLASSSSLVSSIVPSYMAPTESAKARSSRLGEGSVGSNEYCKHADNSSDRLSVSSGTKKRASRTSSSPARSRLSASSNTDGNSIAG